MTTRAYDAGKLASSVTAAGASRRADEGFAAHNVSPSARTRAAAIEFELWRSDDTQGWPGVAPEDCQFWLDDIYAGRCTARVLKDGDVAIGAYKEKSK
jgi:hypothetical protein